MLVLGLVVGGAVGMLLGFLMGSFEDLLGSHPPTHMLTTGHVEGPAGFDSPKLRVVASRNGRRVNQAELDGQGRFRMKVRGDGPFDLHVTNWAAWRDQHAIDPAPVPDVFMEGAVHGLEWGACGVLVRVTPVQLADASVRVLGPDGAPVPEATVWLRSMTDDVRQSTNAAGMARFVDLPVRSWRAVSSMPSGGEAALVTGWRDFVPQGQALDLPIPTGTRVFARFEGPVPADVELTCEVPNLIHIHQVIPWRPDSDGRMAIFVPPDCRSLSLDAREYLERTERKTITRTFAAGAIAVSMDAELVLQPLDR